MYDQGWKRVETLAKEFNQILCAGLAVLADMLLTTHFMALVMLTIWRVPLVMVVVFYIVFAPIEATYWSSTLEKIPTGMDIPNAHFSVTY